MPFSQMSHKVDDSIVTSKEESSLNLQFQQQTDVSDPRKRLPAVYSNPSLAGYLRPWRFLPAERSGTSKVTYAKTSRFEVNSTCNRILISLKLTLNKSHHKRNICFSCYLNDKR